MTLRGLSTPSLERAALVDTPVKISVLPGDYYLFFFHHHKLIFHLPPPSEETLVVPHARGIKTMPYIPCFACALSVAAMSKGREPADPGGSSQ